MNSLTMQVWTIHRDWDLHCSLTQVVNEANDSHLILSRGRACVRASCLQCTGIHRRVFPGHWGISLIAIEHDLGWPWRIYTMYAVYVYRRTIEPAYHYLTIIGVGALPGTYVHRLWMHARFYDCNETTWRFCVRWFVSIDGRWSGRKDMADQMLSLRHGATESPTRPIHYLETHNSVEGTETFIRKPRVNSMRRIFHCVRASS
jgi:hypothetical protein